jgi:hypothetical protein
VHEPLIRERDLLGTRPRRRWKQRLLIVCAVILFVVVIALGLAAVIWMAHRVAPQR